MEGTLGIFVRGGDTSGNGLYFDGVPLYVTSHLLGLFSVIPPEMADKADFYKGGLPATSGSYFVGFNKRFAPKQLWHTEHR